MFFFEVQCSHCVKPKEKHVKKISWFYPLQHHYRYVTSLIRHKTTCFTNLLLTAHNFYILCNNCELKIVLTGLRAEMVKYLKLQHVIICVCRTLVWRLVKDEASLKNSTFGINTNQFLNVTTKRASKCKLKLYAVTLNQI